MLGSITFLFIPNSRIQLIRLIGLCASLITFLYSLVLLIQFDLSTAKFHYIGKFAEANLYPVHPTIVYRKTNPIQSTNL